MSTHTRRMRNTQRRTSQRMKNTMVMTHKDATHSTMTDALPAHLQDACSKQQAIDSYNAATHIIKPRRKRTSYVQAYNERAEMLDAINGTHTNRVVNDTPGGRVAPAPRQRAYERHKWLQEMYKDAERNYRIQRNCATQCTVFMIDETDTIIKVLHDVLVARLANGRLAKIHIDIEHDRFVLMDAIPLDDITHIKATDGTPVRIPRNIQHAVFIRFKNGHAQVRAEH